MEPIGYNKKKASKLMQSKGVDVLVASSPENVFYASGMPVRHVENNPILYVLANQYPTIVAIKKDGEESLISWQLFTSTDKATWIKDVTGIVSVGAALESLASIVRESGMPDRGTIGIESKMPYYQYERLANEFPSAKFRMSDDIFLEMRLEKSEEEIRRMKESTRIAESAIEAMIDSVKEGVSDNELIKVAKAKIIEEGGWGVDHVTLGIGGSDPEYPGTGVRMKRGDLARFDIGAIYGGYSSDVSRHASIGSPPEDIQEASDFMIELQQVCVDAIKPGVKPEQAYMAAEAAHKKSGKEMPFFVTFHSVGILTEEFHFYDPMKGVSPLPFTRNNVLDIEIWTLSASQGLLGIEDTYMVTAKGTERISSLERKIYCVS
ncbi:MAG: Xaa-Pro peptidase family protein [Promethearchaeati archaeon SRVP18_Atabeyarchaeia-1]